jgi:outer membrane lipoprotein-sorting protein
MRSTILPALLVCGLMPAGVTYAQTADEIVASNLKAKGGIEKLKSISSVKMIGKMTAQGREMPMTVYSKRPNLLRQDIKLPVGSVVQAFDGTTAWVIPPGEEAAREVTGPQAEGARKNADFDSPLLDYAAKGHKIELVGKEKAGGADVYHLRLVKKDGAIEHYYIDATTNLEVKRTAEVDAGGATQLLESELSDYKPIDGMMIPHTIKQSMGGMPVSQMTIDSIVFNGPMEDTLFKMPAKK